MKSLFTYLAIVLILVPGSKTSAQGDEPSPVNSIVRVKMTSQGYYFYQPWEKVKPKTRQGLGAVLKGNKVLAGAEFLANATYIEITHPVTGKNIQAKIEAIDYEANLALLAPVEPMFADRVPLEIDPDLSPGDKIEAWQVESNGTPLVISAKISRAQMGTTFLEGNQFLQYEAVGVMQFRGGSVTVPMIHNKKLAGLLVSYDSKEQVSEVISGPVIEHFLNDVSDGKYQGFPKFGISFSETLDDQFRKYLKLPEDGGGIYVGDVKENSSAALSGIKKGDVILSIDGYNIDTRGYYTDKKYGKLSYMNLVQSKPQIGDKLKVEILRDGEQSEVTVTLGRQPVSGELIDPYMFDRAPRYVVSGGLVFQELTRTYLKMYGNDWKTRAPFKLTYADSYPKQFEDKGLNKLVFMSRVIPTDNNVGYGKLSNLIVTNVNDRKITDIKALDKALESPIDGYHKIEFTEYPSIIYIDAKEALETNEQLKKDYGIHELKQIE